MGALALMIAACTSNNDNPVVKPPQPAQPTQPTQKAEGITITAQLAPKTNGAAKTRAISDEKDYIKAEWAVDEHVAILYEVSFVKKVADAKIIEVNDTTGAATIEFTVEEDTPDSTACTLVYPLSAAKDDLSGVKDAATLLANQDGTLNDNLDVRVGAGIINTTTPDLMVTTQPEAQFAIFLFTTKNAGATAAINVNPLIVTIGGKDYAIRPKSATSTLYAALPAITEQAVTFTAKGSDKKIYTASKPSVTFDAGNYYQSDIKMGAANEGLPLGTAKAKDVGKIVGADGNFYDTKAIAEAVSIGNAVAMIAHAGTVSDRGLAIALKDESPNLVDFSHAVHSVSSAKHKPNGSGLTWRLPTIYEWQQMFKGCGASGSVSSEPRTMSCAGLVDKLRNAGGDDLRWYYWANTESGKDSAWRVFFFTSDTATFGISPKVSGGDGWVRACLSFYLY